MSVKTSLRDLHASSVVVARGIWTLAFLKNITSSPLRLISVARTAICDFCDHIYLPSRDSFGPYDHIPTLMEPLGTAIGPAGSRVRQAGSRRRRAGSRGKQAGSRGRQAGSRGRQQVVVGGKQVVVGGSM